MGTKPPTVRPPRRPEKEEKDTGFNGSHGYGIGHGGPSGPGDVPGAITPQLPAKLVPAPADEDEDTVP